MSGNGKATPRPWVAQESFAHFWMVDALNGPGTVAHGLHEADAELIVRAANAHDELIAALQEIRDINPFVVVNEGDYRNLVNGICDAAIQKARGR